MMRRAMIGLCGSWCLLAALASAQEEGRPDRTAVSADVRTVWQELDADERRQLQENYERWKRLPAEEREDMRRRHGRLERLAGEVEESLPDDERERLRALPPREARREMQRRTRDLLHRSRNLLPEDARRALQPRRGESRAERHVRFQDQLSDQVLDRLRRMVARLEERGSLEPEYVRGLQRRMEGLSPGDRFLVVRDLLLKDPEAFRMSPEVVRRLERARSPVSVLRLLPEMAAWDLPSEDLRRYLRDEEGMPEEDLRGLQRWLHGQGVSRQEIRRLFEGEESDWRQRMRTLRKRYDLPNPPRSFNGPEGRSGPGGRGPAPGRFR